MFLCCGFAKICVILYFVRHEIKDTRCKSFMFFMSRILCFVFCE